MPWGLPSLRDLPFSLSTLVRRGVVEPSRPDRVLRQLAVLRIWGYTLTGELRAAAARHPERAALIDERGAVSYADLVRRTDHLAHGLAGPPVGLRAGDRLGVLCRNHASMVELLVAASTLGADAVLINTGLGPTQVRAVAGEQRLRAICHDEEFAAAAVRLPHDLLRIGSSHVDDLIATAAAAGGRTPRRPSRDGRTIVLTSGTTGAPKGAARPVPPGLAPLVSILSRIPLHTGERMLVAAPLFHTWGLAALQLSFALAATTVLRRRFDPADTQRTIAETGCTVLFAVPIMLQRLLEYAPAGERPAALRVVASSGSALPGDLAIRFMDAYGDILYNLYGSTEVSWASIATPADLRRSPATAGRPPPRTRVAVLDQDDRPAPTGDVGRIFVGNEMLFDGYTSGGGRPMRHGMLATGDVGHVDAAGLLYVDGREDDMIVSGGENVYPGEVEHVIATMPGVREVAVAGVPDPEYGQRLAAYIVPGGGARVDAEAVRAYVRGRLARYCVPRDVVLLGELPRNATGKVVIRDLPPAGAGQSAPGG